MNKASGKVSPSVCKRDDITAFLGDSACSKPRLFLFPVTVSDTEESASLASSLEEKPVTGTGKSGGQSSIAASVTDRQAPVTVTGNLILLFL